MCGSKSIPCSSITLTEVEFMKRKSEEEAATCLLELSACNDLSSLRREIEEKSLDIDEPGFWYCRRVWSKKMGFEERTPLMVAAMYGSIEVLNHIIATGKSDVNRVCGDEKVTALHCAVSGCSVSIIEVIKILLDASASPNCVDANGNKPVDLLARAFRFVPNRSRKAVELLLTGSYGSVSLVEEKEGEEEQVKSIVTKYPADASLPDINEGVYGTDQFRMFSFKVKPCSRAYSHDWTECPFVHPGENARRRDPRKYPYTCVPCPEFRKGSCPKGDSCEYAHGVFESWLHPAQYRTRLCKDETGCARKVCFFAHKRDELRPVNASTGSAMVSPRSSNQSTSEMPVMSPLTLGSSPMNSPIATNGIPLSPRNGGLWQNRVNSLTPPPLQLNSSRLKSNLNARDMDIEMELRLCGLDNRRLSDFKSSSLEDTSGSYNSSFVMQPQSPSRHSQMNHYLSSPVRQPPSSHGLESSAAMTAAVMNARSSAFAKRSLSFKPASVAFSPSGKLEWEMQREELSKLRRSASFGIHRNNNNNNNVSRPTRDYSDEPDVSWVNSLVKESAPERSFGLNEGLGNTVHGAAIRDKFKLQSWTEQMYIDHEQQQILT